MRDIEWYIHDYWFEFNDVDGLDWERSDGLVRIPLESGLAPHARLPLLELVVHSVQAIRVAEESGTGGYDVNTISFDPDASEIHVIGNVAIDLVFHVDQLRVEVVSATARSE